MATARRVVDKRQPKLTEAVAKIWLLAITVTETFRQTQAYARIAATLILLGHLLPSRPLPYLKRSSWFA